jgi:hypothetical protein
VLALLALLAALAEWWAERQALRVHPR